MDINKNNLDEWLFDYFEGNLTPRESDLLEKYIESNPSFRKDYLSWKHSFLTEEDIDLPYSKADLLKKKSFWERKWFGWFMLSMSVIFAFGLIYYNYEEHSEKTNEVLVERRNSPAQLRISDRGIAGASNEALKVDNDKVIKDLSAGRMAASRKTTGPRTFLKGDTASAPAVERTEKLDILEKTDKPEDKDGIRKSVESVKVGTEKLYHVPVYEDDFSSDSAFEESDPAEEMRSEQKSKVRKTKSKTENQYRDKGSFRLRPGKTVKDMNSNF